MPASAIWRPTTKCPNLADFARQVALHMRDRDLEEVTATGWATGRQEWADHITALLESHAGRAVIRGASRHGRPVSVFGAIECWPGVWSAWMVATDEWPRVALRTTRAVIREVLPAVWARGAHRIEARSISGYDEAHRWLKTLGASHESTLQAFGRDQQDFEVFVWRSDDHV